MINQSLPEQERLIETLDLRSVINNEKVLINFFTDKIPNTMFMFLIERINRELEEGKLIKNDLMLFKTGWVADRIINLESYAKKEGRDIQKGEVGELLSYMTMINDVETQNITFTNPTLIKASSSYPDRHELNSWLRPKNFTHLSAETKNLIYLTLLKNDQYKTVEEIIEKTVAYEKEYRKSLGEGDVKYNQHSR